MFLKGIVRVRADSLFGQVWRVPPSSEKKYMPRPFSAFTWLQGIIIERCFRSKTSELIHSQTIPVFFWVGSGTRTNWLAFRCFFWLPSETNDRRASDVSDVGGLGVHFGLDQWDEASGS